MSRNVNVVILCEDPQHEVFARRFLARVGYNPRRQRVHVNPKGRGSGEQFVREHFAEELAFYRSRAHRVQQALVVLIDADGRPVDERLRQIESAVSVAGIQPRQANERVAIFVSARNVETWLAYLDGQSVDETRRYPRLRRERDCQKHVDRLYEMCQSQEVRQPSPPSLAAACEEYRARLQA